ncbi:HD domain-containing protein [Candidatus Pacearchaeota archaeon]|nr:HD domain-containing protein [Candidatus Pacearchaeota archaeon]
MTELTEEFYEELKQKIIPYFEELGTHDFNHTTRVLNLALHIGKKENANLEVLRFACLLHDIAHKEQDECKGKICHAERGAELTREILGKYKVDEDKINEIVHCVETHRSRNELIPESKEAKILYDSDKLDAMGAIGILRSAVFAGKVGAVVHNPEITPSKENAYTKEDSAYHEYLFKLKNIKEKMITEEGKRIAEERHRFMEDFFDRANKEVEGEL